VVHLSAISQSTPPSTCIQTTVIRTLSSGIIEQSFDEFCVFEIPNHRLSTLRPLENQAKNQHRAYLINTTLWEAGVGVSNACDHS
jgi:hypothetical protein